jgi:hypothetical protein
MLPYVIGALIAIWLIAIGTPAWIVCVGGLLVSFVARR